MSEDMLTIDPGATIAVEVFKIMPNLRWIERTETIHTDRSGNVMTGKTFKVLQQLHFGNMGTEKWEDVPMVKE
jgi:hypothetical protein